MNMYGTSGFPLSNAGYFNLGKSDKVFHGCRRKYFLIFLFFGLGSVALTRGKIIACAKGKREVSPPVPGISWAKNGGWNVGI